MPKLLLDTDLRARLRDLNVEWEVCDESGRTLGHFLPADLYQKLLYAWAKSLFDDEDELKRARQEPGGMSTVEALAYLEGMARPGQRPS